MVNNAQASLLVQGGPTSGMRVPLSATPVAMGRRSDNDLVVDDTTVSRRHALVMGAPGGFVVRDLNTTNGTFVGAGKIGQGERSLANGDQIRLAGSDVTFVFNQVAPATVQMQGDWPETGMISIEADAQ